MGDCGGKAAGRRELFRGAQGLLEFFVLRDIPNDLGCSNDVSFPVLDRRYCKRDLNSFARFGNPNSLKVINPFSASYLAEDHVLIAIKFGGNYHENRFSDHLFGLVSEYG